MTEFNKEEMHVVESTIKPLVTFAIFSYNQEKYIREAVKSALAQTYEPLEIILSDDCSTDATFAIMNEMVGLFQQKENKTIILNRTQKNSGLWSHISNVTLKANGKFIVMAAGDDISLPNRVSHTIDHMLISGAEAFAAPYNEIGEDSSLRKLNVENNYQNNFLWNYINYDKNYFVNGATSAYKRQFLCNAIKWLSTEGEIKYLNNEDMALTACAIASKSIIENCVHQPLINYRIQSDSTSNFIPSGKGFKKQLNIVKREWTQSRSAYAITEVLRLLMQIFPQFKIIINHEQYSKHRHISFLESTASSPNLLLRFSVIKYLKSLSDLRIIVPRLFGMHILAGLKLLKDVLNAKNL